MNTPVKAILTAFIVAGTLRAEEPSPAPSPEAEAPTPTPAAAVEAPVVQAADTATLEGKVGSEVIVEGVVQNVGTGPNGNITFLNFGDRQTGFVAVVFRPAYDKFPEGFERYAQQKVRVRGQLEKYRDRQIQVKIFTPDQLEVVASEVTP